MQSIVKRISMSMGVYRPMRHIKRALSPSQSRQFRAYRSTYAGLFGRGDLVFDVGANIGNMAEIMLSLGADVVAFEPQPDCAQEVRARGNSRLRVVAEALGAAPGTADLQLKSVTALASLVPNWGGDTTAVIQVPVTTLDAAIEQFGVPRFCKIDVEGYEVEVLSGLTTPLQGLSLEYNSDERGLKTLAASIAHLKRLGAYKANLTAYEDGALLRENWCPAEDLLSPGALASAAYGDVFLTLA